MLPTVLIVLAFLVIFFLLPAKNQGDGKEITPPAAQEATAPPTAESGSSLPDFHWNWELLQSNPLLGYFTEYLGEFFGPVIFWSVVAILLVIVLSGPYNMILSYSNKTNNVVVYKWDGVIKNLVEILKFLFIISLLVSGVRLAADYITGESDPQLSPRELREEVNTFTFNFHALDAARPGSHVVRPNDQIQGLVPQASRSVPGNGKVWYGCYTSPSHPFIRFSYVRGEGTQSIFFRISNSSKVQMIRKNISERAAEMVLKKFPGENTEKILYSPGTDRDWDSMNLMNIIHFMTDRGLMAEKIVIKAYLASSQPNGPTPCRDHEN